MFVQGIVANRLMGYGMDVVWDGRSDGSGDETGMVGFGDRSTGWGKTAIFLANVGLPNVTNGGFMASRPLPKSLWYFLFRIPKTHNGVD